MSSDSLKNFYDKLYSENPGIFGRTSLVFLTQAVDKLGLSGGHALDVGSGEGVTAAFLAARGYIVDAVDISENAFSAIPETETIRMHKQSIVNFPITTTYDFVYIALTAHHLSSEEFEELIVALQEHAPVGGIHAFRLFTTNSAFFTQSNGHGYYDDGSNLDALYAGWDTVVDEKIASQAATQEVQNEVRAVAFQKKG